MSNRCPRLWRCVCLACVLLCSFTRFAIAEPDIDILQAKFGFADSLAVERWTPVRLVIASKKDPFSGLLIVQHPQDATQQARVMLPAATTPGKATTLEVVLNVPQGVDELEFSFINDEGFRTIRYTNRGGGSRLLPTLDAIGQMVLCIEPPTSLARALSPRREITQADVSMSFWDGVVYGNSTSGELPLSWAAYDCADAVVVPGDLGLSPDRPVDPRAMEALMAWVHAGGRLVVLADVAGDGWKRFLDKLDVVSMGETGVAPVPEPIRNALAKPDVIQGEMPDTFSAADSIKARAMRPTPLGESMGWRITLPFGSEGSGLTATGPVGFGMVTLVAFDPARAASVVSDVAAARVWRSLLRPVIESAPRRASPDRIQQMRYYSWGSSGATAEEESAIASCLGAMADVPRLGHGVFVAIGAAVLLLAMLVGPFDAIVLRRAQARHHAWLTALGWITLASFACYFAPAAFRSGSNAIFRLGVNDVIQSPEGAAVLARRARSGLTGFFPSSIGSLQVADTCNGVFYRGVSPITSRGGRTITGSMLPLVQGTSMGGDLRATNLGTLPLRQWSFRAVLDVAPDSAVRAPKVTLQPKGDSWIVSLEGVASGAKVLSAAIQTRRAWHELAPGVDPDKLEAGSAALSRAPESWRSISEDSEFARGNTWNARRGNPIAGVVPGKSLSLPWTGQRHAAIDAYLASGRWACVYLAVTGEPTGLELKGAAWNSRTWGIYRILVPLTEPIDPSETTN